MTRLETAIQLTKLAFGVFFAVVSVKILIALNGLNS